MYKAKNKSNGYTIVESDDMAVINRRVYEYLNAHRQKCVIGLYYEVKGVTDKPVWVSMSHYGAADEGFKYSNYMDQRIVIC